MAYLIWNWSITFHEGRFVFKFVAASFEPFSWTRREDVATKISSVRIQIRIALINILVGVNVLVGRIVIETLEISIHAIIEKRAKLIKKQLTIRRQNFAELAFESSCYQFDERWDFRSNTLAADRRSSPCSDEINKLSFKRKKYW